MPRPDKRHEIMRAAEKLFTRRRFHEITVEDIAREAHVGKGTIYLHFKDKDALFFEVATSGFDELCRLLQRKVPEDAPFEAQLSDTCVQISGFFDRRRQLLRMIQSEEARISWCRGDVRNQWTEKRQRLVAAVAEILDKGRREGKVRSDIAPEVLAHFLLGMLRTLGRNLSDVRNGSWHEWVVDLFLAGAATTRKPAARGLVQESERT